MEREGTFSSERSLFNKLRNRSCRQAPSKRQREMPPQRDFCCQAFSARNDLLGRIPGTNLSLGEGPGAVIWVPGEQQLSVPLCPWDTLSPKPQSHTKGCFPACLISQQSLQGIDRCSGLCLEGNDLL